MAQCEIDPFCRAVLKRHWPKAKLFDDITKIDPAEFPAADVWTAGFPCQDVSLARGNHGRDGLKGNHSSLFFELIDLVEAKKPKIIVLENVVGLLNSHKGCDFAIILRELTKHGYAVAWRVLNARYFGTPQSRSRVFMVAWRGDYELALRSLFEHIPGAKIGHERARIPDAVRNTKTLARSFLRSPIVSPRPQVATPATTGLVRMSHMTIASVVPPPAKASDSKGSQQVGAFQAIIIARQRADWTPNVTARSVMRSRCR